MALRLLALVLASLVCTPSVASERSPTDVEVLVEQIAVPTDGAADGNAEWELPMTKSLFPSLWQSFNEVYTPGPWGSFPIFR